MQGRKVLCLQPASGEQVALDELSPDWDVHYATLESAPSFAEFQVGLVVLDGRGDRERLEELLSSSDVEWIALIPPGGIEDHALAQLVIRYCIDYHTLPVEPQRLRAAIGHAKGMGALSRALVERNVKAVAGRLVGSSPVMRELGHALAKVAAVDAPVLILGESGTGKELAAQAIHELSGRASGPFVAVNCGALPPGLIQSELFGHERGAFTGAQKRKIGRIEAAHGGTILLDEIGDLDLDLQVNLLRFLQEGVIERVGGSGPIPVDVRVVAATHVDLEAAIAARRFRADLYYRLNVLRLRMPALRERREDIEQLVMHFFTSFEADRAPGVRGFSREAIAAMLRHNWPGNVRELVNRVRRGMVMCEGRLITPKDLGLAAERTHAPPSLADARAQAERAAVRQALITTRYNVSQAAELLGVSRVTLYRLIDKYDLQEVHSAEPVAEWRGKLVVNG